MALFTYFVLRIRVDVVKTQLQLAFPQKSKREISSLARKTYINLAYNAIEFIWFAGKSFSRLRPYLTIHGLGNIEKALSYKKGAILIMGHLGNWELGAQVIEAYTGKLYAVIQKQRNPYFNEFINYIRTDGGRLTSHLIPKKYALRGIIQALRKNSIVLMLPDQHAGSQGIIVDFFARPASTPQGIAKIALKQGCPLLFATCIRGSNGKFSLHITEPMFFTPRQSIDEDIIFYTQKFTTLLEKWVTQYPTQWFWLHKRWRVKSGD
jgi:KDO2-lipid IV(A) lauroyltransferase